MYPPQHAGGYELMWQAAMAAARRRGHAVRVLTSDYRAGDRPDAEPDVHRTLRWYWDLERYVFPDLGPWQRLGVERHNHAELRRHLTEFTPDVVAWWSMGCMSLSLIERVRRLGIAGVFVVHDDWLDYGWERDQWLHMWQGPRRGRLAPLADRAVRVPTRVDIERAGSFVFNSHYTLAQARRSGVCAVPARVVHPGIDARFLHARDARPWHGRLLCVGRIDRQKGIDTAIRALAELPETTLTVRGSGDQGYVDEMATLARELGVASRVTVGGFASAEELASVYAAADAVLFPVRWNEPFGLVPLEAMGVGRPVISTARGGTAEFVTDGDNALVFAAGDVHGLADRVRRLAGDAALRERLRAGGLATAARYTAERFAEQTVDAIVAGAGAGVRGADGRGVEADA